MTTSFVENNRPRNRVINNKNISKNFFFHTRHGVYVRLSHRKRFDCIIVNVIIIQGDAVADPEIIEEGLILIYSIQHFVELNMAVHQDLIIHNSIRVFTPLSAWIRHWVDLCRTEGTLNLYILISKWCNAPDL